MAIELLAPAGDMAAARAAFQSGADAVYLGMKRFSARAQAGNFSPDELRAAVGLARSVGGKVYAAVNTLADDADLGEVAETLWEARLAGAHGVIVQDIGVARMCREHFPELELHASTQMAAHNLEGVLALKEFGFSRVVLAREVPIADIRKICERGGVEIEVFVHGALCYSVSGLCLYSSLAHGRSGNKGQCAYCCRNRFLISQDLQNPCKNRQNATDSVDSGPDSANPVKSGNGCFPFSMRDLRLADDLEALVDAGAASLKIEGRMKSEVYVGAVTRFYRERLDKAAATVSESDLDTIFARRTTTLYAHGRPLAGRSPAISTSVTDPANRTHLGAKAGVVKTLTKDRQGRTWLRFHTLRPLERHDGLQFEIPGQDRPVGFGIGAMRLAISRRNVFEAPAGSDVEVEVPHGLISQDSQNPRHNRQNAAAMIKPGMTVWCGHSEAVSRRFAAPGASRAEIDLAGQGVDICVELSPEGVRAIAQNGIVGEVEVVHPARLEPAKNPERTEGAVREAFSRWGGTQWNVAKFKCANAQGLFAPASILNAARRELCEALDAAAERRKNETLEAIALEATGLISQDSQNPARNRQNLGELPARSLKIRLDQWREGVGEGFDELVVALAPTTRLEEVSRERLGDARLALPLWVWEDDFAAVRTLAKRLFAAGWRKWEAPNLAGIRMLRAIGVEDLTADWTVFATNRLTLAELGSLGVRAVVESPEKSNAPNAANGEFFSRRDAEASETQRLCDSASSASLREKNEIPELIALEGIFAPMFMSVTAPAGGAGRYAEAGGGRELEVFEAGGLWVAADERPRGNRSLAARAPTDARAQASRVDFAWKKDLQQ